MEPEDYRKAIHSRLNRLEGHLNQLRGYADEEWDDIEGIYRKVNDIADVLPEINRLALQLEEALSEEENKASS